MRFRFFEILSGRLVHIAINFHIDNDRIFILLHGYRVIVKQEYLKSFKCTQNKSKLKKFALFLQNLVSPLFCIKQVFAGLNLSLLNQKQPSFIISILSFCRHELHVIVDEIYMLSVFDESATFHSVLGMDR